MHPGLLGAFTCGGSLHLGGHRKPAIDRQGKSGHFAVGVHRSAGAFARAAARASADEAHRELIVEALGGGRSAMAICQVLVVDHGLTARYASEPQG